MMRGHTWWSFVLLELRLGNLTWKSGVRGEELQLTYLFVWPKWSHRKCTFEFEAGIKQWVQHKSLASNIYVIHSRAVSQETDGLLQSQGKDWKVALEELRQLQLSPSSLFVHLIKGAYGSQGVSVGTRISNELGQNLGIEHMCDSLKMGQRDIILQKVICHRAGDIGRLDLEEKRDRTGVDLYLAYLFY